jgi:hypothetical protein
MNRTSFKIRILSLIALIAVSKARIGFEIFDLPAFYEENDPYHYFMEDNNENKFLNYFNPEVYMNKDFKVSNFKWQAVAVLSRAEIYLLKEREHEKFNSKSYLFRILKIKEIRDKKFISDNDDNKKDLILFIKRMRVNFLVMEFWLHFSKEVAQKNISLTQIKFENMIKHYCSMIWEQYYKYFNLKKSDYFVKMFLNPIKKMKLETYQAIYEVYKTSMNSSLENQYIDLARVPLLLANILSKIKGLDRSKIEDQEKIEILKIKARHFMNNLIYKIIYARISRKLEGIPHHISLLLKEFEDSPDKFIFLSHEQIDELANKALRNYEEDPQNSNRVRWVYKTTNDIPDDNLVEIKSTTAIPDDDLREIQNTNDIPDENLKEIKNTTFIPDENLKEIKNTNDISDKSLEEIKSHYATFLKEQISNNSEIRKSFPLFIQVEKEAVWRFGQKKISDSFDPLNCNASIESVFMTLVFDRLFETEELPLPVTYCTKGTYNMGLYAIFFTIADEIITFIGLIMSKISVEMAERNANIRKQAFISIFYFLKSNVGTDLYINFANTYEMDFVDFSIKEELKRKEKLKEEQFKEEEEEFNENEEFEEEFKEKVEFKEEFEEENNEKEKVVQKVKELEGDYVKRTKTKVLKDFLLERLKEDFPSFGYYKNLKALPDEEVLNALLKYRDHSQEKVWMNLILSMKKILRMKIPLKK